VGYYQGSIKEFNLKIDSEDIFNNDLNESKSSSKAEFNSWKNSLPALSKVLKKLKNTDKLYIFIEYDIKFFDKRADAILIGKNKSIIIELKQWTIKKIENAYVYPEYDNQRYIHPSIQAKEYAELINSCFYSNKFESLYCSYLHNIQDNEQTSLIKNYKPTNKVTFTNINNSEDFIDYLQKNLQKIDDFTKDSLINTLKNKNLKKNSPIIDYIQNIINENEFQITLLDKQRNFYIDILQNINKANSTNKQLYILDGKAGTGKTVVAYKILIELFKKQKEVVFSIPSSFLYHLNKTEKAFLPIKHPFKIIKDAKKYHCIIIDEAHRLTKQDLNSLVNLGNCLIFLIDNYQKISSKHISISDIKNLNIPTIKEEKLKYQIRSQGNNAYEKWVYNLFTSQPMKFQNSNDFFIKIYDNIEQLEKELSKQKNKKLLAGFTWNWSPVNIDGSLVNDIKIDNWEKPWNNKELLENKKYLEFYKDNTLDEVGSIYTAQGIEYDYIGLILGNDISYNKSKGFLFHPDKNKEKSVDSDEIIKNIYITLLTRARKGIYIYAIDDNIKSFLKTLIK